MHGHINIKSTHVIYMTITVNIKHLIFIIDDGVFNERQKIKLYMFVTLNPCINKIGIQPRVSRRPLTAEILFLFQASHVIFVVDKVALAHVSFQQTEHKW